MRISDWSSDVCSSDLLNSPAARDVAYFLHPYTNAKAHEQNGPMIIERGEGVYVYDDAGKPYLEAMAGLWCASLGFNEKRLVQAATDQLNKLPYYHTFAHKAPLPGIDLADKDRKSVEKGKSGSERGKPS